ncbi:MAG: type II toxin-antitoxin system VapC family toxin [Acidimicrobiia bacterium]|nr:type II toxin-antitoxin system VapC family toxin [Acidimicrobiia bacterium]
MHFFDASALVKRYVREAGSTTVERLLDADMGAVSRLSEVEIASALERLTRDGACSVAERNRALSALEKDLRTLVTVEMTPTVVTQARALLQRHALRASDAIQLASCAYSQEQLQEDVTLVAFDRRLVVTWRAEGFHAA